MKLNISFVIFHWKHIAQPKIKVYFVKNALKTINEEVKGVRLMKIEPAKPMNFQWFCSLNVVFVPGICRVCFIAF